MEILKELNPDSIIMEDWTSYRITGENLDKLAVIVFGGQVSRSHSIFALKRDFLGEINTANFKLPHHSGLYSKALLGLEQNSGPSRLLLVLKFTSSDAALICCDDH